MRVLEPNKTVDKPMSDDVQNVGATTKRITVCFVIDRLTRAGTETQLLRLIDQMDETQFHPILCLLDGSSKESQMLEPDCTVVRYGVTRIKSFQSLRSMYAFSRFLRKQNVDIVQPYFPDSTFFAFVAARLAGVPHVVRNRRNLGYKQTGLENFLGKVYSRTSMTTAANSEACRQAVIEQEAAKPKSVVVIPNGADLDKLSKIEPPTPERLEQPNIGMVANLRPVKDPMTLLNAAVSLSNEFPGLRLSLVGKGPLDSELNKTIEANQLQNRFQLLGSLNDVVDFLGSLDVAVLSSSSEGLSNAIIEYMAAARPIVATDVGGNPDLIEHEVTGILVPPSNEKKMAEAIRRMITDRPFAVACANNARDKALVNYGLRQQAERFESHWRTLVN